MRFKILNIILLCLVFFWGCTKEDTVGDGRSLPEEVRIKLMISTPGAKSGLSRAVDEDALNEVTVLVMEDRGNGLEFVYSVIGYSIGSSPTADYQFQARIVPIENPAKFFVIGNSGPAVNAVTPGMNEQQVREAVIMAYGSAGFTDYLPMSGEVPFPDGITSNQTKSAVLVRSVARVDVVNNAANFNLTSVKVYRAGSAIQIIPNSLVYNVAQTPSVPSGSSRSIATETFPVTGNTITEQIYIPESAMPATGDRTLTATTVVVGGQFNGEQRTTYYRMDFIPRDAPELFGQVLRNHIYRFQISEVLAAGWQTDDDASVYPSSDIEAEIKVWNPVTTDMVFDNFDYFGVSTRTVMLSYRSGASQVINVDTSLETYVGYWTDATGTIDTEAGSITLGEDFTDPEDIFEVFISGDGTSIIVTALDRFDDGADLPKYLKLVAGRLEIIITITQSPPVYAEGASVNVFNVNDHAGHMGNYVLINRNEAENRARGLVRILQNSGNFGPTGTIGIEGVYISGMLIGNNYSLPIANLYDVIYLPYEWNPPADILIEWLESSSKRVLIVQHDNAATNPALMAQLGVPYAGSNSTALYTLSPRAPDFITDGPFGQVTSAMQVRCYDNIHGEITVANAEANGIIPILIGGGGGVVLGVDPVRRIVFSGDIDIYSPDAGGAAASQYLSSTTGDITNEPATMMANLWAWITETVLAE